MAPRVRLLLVVAGLCVVLLYGTLSVGVAWAHLAATVLGRRDGWDAGDFATVYSAARLLVTGHGHRIYDLAALTEIRVNETDVHGADRLAYLNPPFFAALLTPLAHLGFARAFQVWTALSVAATALTGVIVWQETRSLPRLQRAALLGILVTSYPLAFALRLGQFSALLMVSWTTAYACLRRGRGRGAGVALAVLLIKPELLIPPAALLLWKKRYDVLSTLLPLTAIAVAASFLVAGPETGLSYPGFVLSNAQHAANGTRAELMFGWNGWFGALLGGGAPTGATLLSLPFIVLTLAGAALALRRFDAAAAAFPTQWLVLTLVALLADPNLFLQDLVVAGPALCIAVASWRQRPRVLGAGALVVAWLTASLGLDPGALWHLNLLSTEMIAATAFLAWRVWPRPTDGSPEPRPPRRQPIGVPQQA